MSKKRVAVVGSSGRMGTELLRLLREDSVLEFSVGVSRSAVAHLEQTVDSIEKIDPKSVDIIVDFSLPEASEAVINWCVNNQKTLVSGTTGISESTKASLVRAAQKIPVLWSPNMSLGVAILNKVLSQLPRVEGFEFQLEEFHHAQKKDMPSGTAILLQNTLESRLGKKVNAPLSIRGGGIFGIHKIHMMGQEETLTFEHNALNRAVFAKGALVAAKWIVGKPPGYYQMADVLGAL